MSSSDYLAIKKRKQSGNFFPTRSSGKFIENKQYLSVQSTPIVDEDGDLIPTNTRFSIPITLHCDLAVYETDHSTINKIQPIFNPPIIQTPMYVKNRHQSPFCWACDFIDTEENVDQLINEIGCSMCETIQVIMKEELFCHEEKEEEKEEANY